MKLVYSGDKTFLREPDQINITWRITRNCNYKCWYCYEYDNKRRPLTFDDAMKVVKFLSKLKQKLIRLNITGGEATLYPRFMNLMANIVVFVPPTSKIKLILWTNLSANVQLYQGFYNLCSQFDNIEPVIVPGFHKGYMNIETFTQKWEALKDYGIEKMVFTVYEDDCFDDVEKVKNYPCIIRSVRGEEEVMENKGMDFGFFHYYYEPVSVFQKDGKYYFSDSLETKEFLKFVCKAYKYNLYIDDDAKAYACPRITRNVKTRPYNLLDEGDVEKLLKRDSIVCPLPDCVCEWFIPKFSMREYHKLKDIINLDFLNSIEKLNKEGVDLREGI